MKKTNFFIRQISVLLALLVIVVFCLPKTSSAATIPTGAFATAWAVGAGATITIPTNPNDTYDYSVDWGDGSSVSTGNTGDASHTYTDAATYNVIITGVFPAIYFNGASDASDLTDVLQWGTNQWQSMNSAFAGCSGLTILSATDVPDLTQVTDLSQMFSGATRFNSNIANWNVSNIRNMSSMFSNATSFNNGDTGNDGNAPLSWSAGTGTSNVTSTDMMFYGDESFNQAVGGWDVSSLQDASSMFSFAYAFNNGDPVNNGNAPLLWTAGTGTSQLQNASWMFYRTRDFNQNINSWNMSHATTTSWMFATANGFNNGDIGNDGNAPLSWNSAIVTSMDNMFNAAGSFNQDVSGVDVSSVINMDSMFRSDSVFNNGGTALTWGSKTSHVTNMPFMFKNTAFNQDVSSWDVSGVDTSGSSMVEMFTGDTLSPANYDALLGAWSKEGLNNGIVLDAGNSLYCNSAAQRKFIIANNNWVINDSGIGEGCTQAYSLTYSAGSNGHILGTKIVTEDTGHGLVDRQVTVSTSRFVETAASGADARQVTAVPNDGYYFVNWTGADTSVDNPRTDKNVAQDISETANFAQGEVPVVQNLSVTNITQTSAVLGGNVVSVGAGSITDESVGYKINKDHQEMLYGARHTGVFGTGNFSGTITDLSCGTQYLYRAQATNNASFEGDAVDQYFTTLPCETSSSSGGGYGYVCADPKAVNYGTYASSGNTSCRYVTTLPPANPSPSTVVQSILMNKIIRVLKLGSKGSDILALQKYLNSHNYSIAQSGSGSPGHENAYFGLLTQKAVMKFQADHGLKTDGVVGPKTWELIK